MVSVKEDAPSNGYYRRRILISGLENATVYFFPETYCKQNCDFADADKCKSDSTPVYSEQWKSEYDEKYGYYYKAENIVVDPVMVATSGSELMKSNAVTVLMKKLLPIATLVTPNIPEAQVLSSLTIETKEDMVTAAQQIGDSYHCAVLLKGGHSINDANDLLYANGSYKWFCGKRIDNPNTHGTGCTLSSAIASNLAKGFTLAESVQRAKDYISGALAAMLDLGEGSGPMNHAFDLQGGYAKEAR